MKKIVAILLSLVMVLSGTISVFADEGNLVEQNEKNSSQYIIGEDGFKYCIKTEIADNGNKVVSISSNKNDIRYVETIDFLDESIKVDEYRGVDLLSTTIVSMEDLSGDNHVSTPFAYGSKVKEKSEGKYWYQNGTKTVSGKTKAFVKIGCIATYEINYTDASSKAQTAFDNYTSYLRKANTNYGKFQTACYALDMSAAAVGALILANIAFPPSIIITIIGGGAALGMVNFYLDYHENFESMKEWYTKAKVYGKKL